MELLFNKSSNGQEEITKLLGFLDSDFSYERLSTDIELNTPDLINIVSEDVYKKILDYYNKETPTEQEKEKYSRILNLSQLYIGLKAYHDLSSNNDLMHTSSGRKMNKAENETTPWDWQIASDNAALKKRAYKTLDQLIIALNKSEITEWLNSKTYKLSKSLFVHNTKIFDDSYPINNSAQLYFRMVSFMEEIQLEEIHSRLGDQLYDRLKDAIRPPNDFKSLTTIEKRLLKCVELSVVYLSLAKGYKVFPIEMFPNEIMYRENTKMKSQARAEVMLYLKEEAKKQLQIIESLVLKLNTPEVNDSTEELLSGLNESNKYVDL